MKSFLVTLMFLLLAGPAAAQSLGDVDRMRKAGQYREALSVLEQARQRTPADAEVLWRLSRTRVDLGEQAQKEAERLVHYRAALADAEAAVAADDAHAQAHLAVAIAAGRVALQSPTKQKVELSRTVKEHVDRAIALNPRDDAALHVRARWHYEVASLGFLSRTALKLVYGGLPDASYEKAARDFEQAITLQDLIRHRVELAKTFLKLDRPADARTHLQRALALPETDPDDPGYKTEARALLKAL